MLQVFALLISLAATCAQLTAQQKVDALRRPQKLPSPEKVVNDYLKAAGGKKRLAAIKDSTCEWTIKLKDQLMGRALTERKAPASTRMTMTFGNGEIQSAASPRSAWVRGLNASQRTLTDAEANAAKLQSALEASHFIDYKKLNVLARTIAFDETLAEPAFVVEFSTRAGARLRYWFGAISKLLLKTVDEDRKTTMRFDDYRARNGVIEPHRIEVASGAEGALTLILQSARYNTGLSDSLFDPPTGGSFDIIKLLHEVAANQKKTDERVREYAFTEKRNE